LQLRVEKEEQTMHSQKTRKEVKATRGVGNVRSILSQDKVALDWFFWPANADTQGKSKTKEAYARIQ
jgi:hypothetical protein